MTLSAQIGNAKPNKIIISTIAITASRMVKVFSKWKTYIDKNKEGMYESLLKLNKANISSNTREVVELILN